MLIIISLLLGQFAFGQSTQTLELFEAIKEGNYKKAKKAIERGADVNGAENENAPTTYPLIKAVKLNHLDIAKLLLEKGANPNINRPIDQQTPLMIAVKQDNPEMIKLLLDFKCDVTAETTFGRNALNISALWNSVRAATVLLEKTDIDVNARNDLCPLAVASRQGHIEMVKLLLAQTNAKASNEKCISSAIEMAKYNKHDEILKLLNPK
jgi:serine/threonine-protein phosphatase 6 regulatory ankyrin repeat subunit B